MWHNCLLFSPGPTEIIIILVIIVLLFGAKKIPQLMRGVGSGVREFKEGVRGDDEEKKENKDDKSGKELNS